jgi:hypothetical protein
MTTQAKRGRPAKKAVEQTPAKKKFSVKQRVGDQPLAYEYKLLQGSGAVFMMHQRNVTLYDKSQDRVRQIRYCPSEPSIFVEEQSEKAVRKSVVFSDGRLLVRPDQPNLREFMELHPENQANGGSLFYRVDKEKKAQLDVTKEFAVADAIMMIKEKPFEDLLSVAASLNFNVDRQASEIKHDLLMYAKRNPSSFIKMFDNPEVTMKAKIRMAIKYGVLEESKCAVRWKDSGNMIVSVPEGKDGTDTLLRFLMTDAGAPTVEELDRQL